MNAGSFASWLLGFLYVYFAAVSVVGVLLALTGWWRTLQHRQGARVAGETPSGWSPPLSIAVLPFGRDPEVRDTVQMTAELGLPGLEVLVVCDGSRGTLLSSLTAAFELKPTYRLFRQETRCARIRAVYASAKLPQVTVIDKEERGTADALNAAVNVARNPLFAFIGSGTRIDPRPLVQMIEDFEYAPPSAAAVAAPRRVDVSGFSSLVHEIARLEYALPPGDGLSSLASSASGSGAFMIYRKRFLELIGGFKRTSHSQGVGISFRLIEELRKWGTRGTFLYSPDPVSWHASSRRNIRRYQAALVLSLMRHFRRLFRYGSTGTRMALAYLMVFEILTPVVEMFSYIALPLLAYMGLIPAASLLPAAALILGGPMLRAGIVALTECSSRERYGRTADVARRFGAVLASPLGLHQIATFGRMFAVLDVVRAYSEPPAMESRKPAAVLVPPFRPTGQVPSSTPASQEAAAEPQAFPLPPPGVTSATLPPEAGEPPRPAPPPLTWAAPAELNPPPAPVESPTSTMAVPDDSDV